MPHSWYAEVLERLTSLAHTEARSLHYCVQSNLVKITDGHLAVFRKYGVRLGTSLDGPPALNDMTRGETERLLENIARCARADVPVCGVIAVITRSNCDRIGQILEYFNDVGILSVALNPGHRSGRGQVGIEALTADELFGAYRQSLEYIVRTSGKRVIDRVTLEKLDRFCNPISSEEYKSTHICSFPFCGYGFRILAFDPSGQMYPCGPAVGRDQLWLGSLADFDYKSYTEKILASLRRTGSTLERCKGCIGRRVCDFGCPSYAYEDPESVENGCEAARKLVRFLETFDRGALHDLVIQTRGVSHERRSIHTERDHSRLL